RSAAFLRFTDHTQAIETEVHYLGHLGEQLRQAGYTHLGELVGQRAGGQPPLLAVAVRFFFRMEIESDPHLFQGLAYEQLARLGPGVQAGFASLAEALSRQGDRLEGALESIGAVVVRTHEAVLDVQAELQRQGEELRRQNEQLYRAVLAMQ